MSEEQWTSVDEYFDGLFAPPEEALVSALQAAADADMPRISVAPNQGKFLALLVQLTHAHKVLEIGSLGGYSAIWMARQLPKDGRLITLEINPKHAEVARQNIERAGLSNKVEVRLGSAHDSLPALHASGEGPFDLVFIDADKVSTPAYLDWALRLTKPGSLIVIDNVVREGAIVDADSPSPDVQGMRTALATLAQHPHLSATALQTVGSKGYDGFAIALVTGA